MKGFTNWKWENGDEILEMEKEFGRRKTGTGGRLGRDRLPSFCQSNSGWVSGFFFFSFFFCPEKMDVFFPFSCGKAIR